jgi:hypothetical protein
MGLSGSVVFLEGSGGWAHGGVGLFAGVSSAGASLCGLIWPLRVRFLPAMAVE